MEEAAPEAKGTAPKGEKEVLTSLGTVPTRQEGIWKCGKFIEASEKRVIR